MSLITAKGNQAVESAAKAKVDLTKVMIRLKDGESVKVRLLSSEDFVEYAAVSSFGLGVYTQPSREPLGEKDYFVEASRLADAKAEGVDEKFKELFPRKRYLIAMADVEQGVLRAWDASKSQFNSFVAALEEYKDIIDDNEEIVFNFKRTGNKTDTTYSLSPVMRPKAPDLEGFHKFDGVTADIPFFESLLVTRTPELQVAVLKENGFPVDKYFPEVSLEAAEETEEVSALDQI